MGTLPSISPACDRLRERREVPTYEVETVRFLDAPPQETDGGQSWYARGQNFLIGYSILERGATLTFASSEDEYVIGVVEGEIEIGSEAGSGAARADAVVIVPPGASRLEALGPVKLFRVFAPPPRELAEACLNWHSYDQPRENVAPFELWP